MTTVVKTTVAPTSGKTGPIVTEKKTTVLATTQAGEKTTREKVVVTTTAGKLSLQFKGRVPFR